MKKFVAAVMLVVCLLLIACDGRSLDRKDGAAGWGRDSSMTDDTILLTIDGREIPTWRYLYWLAYTCQRVQERYQAAGLPLDWETPVSGGTLADYVKDQALADTALYATVENWAEKYGCMIVEEEAQSETSYLPDMGLTAEQMAELERVGQMYAALYELYCTEGSQLAPTDEALAAYGESVGAVTLEEILVPFGEDRTAAQSRAAELFARINGAEDQSAVFSVLMAEYGAASNPQTVWPGEERAEVFEAVRLLGEGQCSGILETETGFSILRRLPLERSALKERYFDELLQTAAEQSAVTTMPEYAELDPASFAAETLSKQNTDLNE